ncbi:hypothetical protein MKY25_05480 [Geobacillus sp. FSL W8-0032]|uniref:hypothetical protein n=1 Tax=Geobacillus TaxID=129337 RepID=UPI0015570E7F|nr:hypothetical protein [Geobacillus subterraneus]
MRSRLNISIRWLTILYSRKFVYTILLLLMISSLFRFYSFLMYKEEKNVFDLLLFSLNDFFHVFFLLSLIYLIGIFPFTAFRSFDHYAMIKLGSRAKWFYTSVISMGIATLLFVLASAFICILESLLTLKFENRWSEYGEAVYHFFLQYNNIKPLTLVLFSLLFLYLFLLTLGITFFVATLIVQNNIIGFIIALGFNGMSMVVYLSKIAFFYRFTFVYHVLLGKMDGSVYSHVIESIMYWGTILALLLCIGMVRGKQMDFHRRRS